MLKNVQFRTKYKDAEKAAEEIAKMLKNSKKFDGTKVFLSKTLPAIAKAKDQPWDPYRHSFIFVSNDKDELQKLADHYNNLYYPNHEKDELLGVNVRKNTDNYEDVFESKKIKAEANIDVTDKEYEKDWKELWDTIKAVIDDFAALSNDGYYETNEECVIFAEAIINLIIRAANERSGNGGLLHIDPSLKDHLNFLKKFVSKY